MNRRAINISVFLLFFVSGGCGLIYQVVWSRMLTQVFGATIFAVSTVLAAFVAGLALGSYWLGKRSDRSGHPLRLFARYEIAIGLTALLTLVALDHLAPLYLRITSPLATSTFSVGLVRFALAVVVLIVPTTLMGATLPILSRYVITRFDQAGKTLSTLYTANTLGAVIGTLLASFLLIGSLGTHLTLCLAAALNIGVGVFAWLLARKPAPGPEMQAADETGPGTETSGRPAAPRPRGSHRLLLVCFAVSGFASFAYEVFWTRALIFYVGNSTYAFATMLSAFLIGIASGAALIRFFVDRLRHPVRFFAWIQVAIGLSASAAMPLLIWLMGTPFVQGLLMDADAHWGRAMLTRFGLSFGVMFVPTLLIGATFPLAARIVLGDLKRTSADVGKVYAVNAVGNIVGALAPAFVLIPLLGIHKGIWLVALANLAAGALLLSRGTTRLMSWRLVCPIGVAALAIGVPFLPVSFQFPSRTQTVDDEVLFYREGPAATTMVFVQKQSGHKVITVDGVPIGGTSPELDYKQQWLAHLPKLLMRDYRSELSVGLGSGMLIGESARHPRLEKIDCVEIAPTVVEGARHFAVENHGVLDSPRVRIIVDDGVNHLMANPETYDIISTDGKTSPEFSVNGVFLSREYYTLMRDRLAPGGLAIQWIPLHYPHEIFRSVLKTFAEAFPHVMLLQADGNCFLVGSRHEVVPDPSLISERLNDAANPFEGLRKYGIENPETLLAHLVARQDVIKSNSAGIATNTLEHPIIEFYDFEDFAVPSEQRTLQNLEFLLSLRGTGAVGAWLEEASPKIAAAHEAEGANLRGQIAILQKKGPEEFERHFQQALALSPENQSIRYQIFVNHFATAQHALTAGKIQEAESHLRRAVRIWPRSAEANRLLGHILLDRGMVAEAGEQFEAALAFEPDDVSVRQRLVTIYFNLREIDRAILHLRAILGREPGNIDSLYQLGFLLGEQGDFGEALELLRKAHRLAPHHPHVIHCLAWITYRSGDREEARKIVREGGDYYKAAREMEQARETILR